MRSLLRAICIVGIGACACLVGCSANVGTGALVSVPKDAASTCATYCGDVGMALDSVVIMANNVGCVCRGAKGAGASGPATAAGAMAALIVDAQQRQQHQQTTAGSH